MNQGQVTLVVDKNADEQDVLIVSDNGIGMSERVLLEVLLDLGSSYWNSDLILEENPGLTSKFEPNGRFGIGFLSLFMLGDEIKVTTRSEKDGPDGTRVLSFHSGATSRTYLRQAKGDEQLVESGTRIEIVLHRQILSRILSYKSPSPHGRVAAASYSPRERRSSWTLSELVSWLCPTIDVNVSVDAGDGVQGTLGAVGSVDASVVIEFAVLIGK